ncbi:protein FRA10AC1 homolog [Cylas formicarius]|uniref:protein FRA10AC1 homolog n=1 Tax=Cylas formicarius TaxID=197179 RepID=UPI0029587B1D|nr:protein FRA10AC1 homolog [Cylas formicarius]
MSLRHQMRYLNPYELHKLLVNEYILKRPGDTKHLQRDCSKDVRDYDVIRQNHKFLWETDHTPCTWEEQFAKKYYDKLFKEYCISDLSRYKENKVALRWRTEKEVVTGKGQFICGNKICSGKEDLRTWEVNFAYKEKEEHKNALVKIRLCPTCSHKLNYHSQKREVKRLYNNFKQKAVTYASKNAADTSSISQVESELVDNVQIESNCNPSVADVSWTDHKPIETKSRDEEMEEYLQDLLL